ncbi:hypothetical protein MJO28_007000 [Puccinia striiformis f. sp. tritici]|uniref:Uncharacterized protein n=2 Tax=Puccinia striiformis f. sp. tritici TaxID=168172 RepID=A0A0L0UT12_9BASI|nr:hypothetical protein Pst134EA_013105 [Puccinia striiformis f. sp. tritici]KAI9622655.1 hypothetical protein H4Q26_014935 [Puccinia striiformis f. sp. tritici PST-130]KNE90155.1 hypothetical protein PSTG_16378 [Puccinia striiformis f. sp. tritici PST-78]KAH9465211.1 hypothetical protein Pst134EA_013105 [Puccinia striiformis f. sp. tritici]KAI7951316.1 hypothetical protein MJO28_007000 [Puccinia striiformis f. sp. tritici]KAI7955558.1 hypothetical protein MJO29_006957 [Puccinia striiformis f.
MMSRSVSQDSDSDVLKIDQSERRKHQQQGDIVVRGFESLIHKIKVTIYDEYPSSRAVQEIPRVVGVDLKKDLINRLNSTLIPLLRKQIISLEDPLDPVDLLKEPGSQFKIILDIQSDLNETIGEIQSALYDVCGEPVYSLSAKKSDQHLQELKLFRLRGIRASGGGVWSQARKVFQESCEMLEKLQLSTEQGDSSEMTVPTHRHYLLCFIACTCNQIATALGWTKGSELDLIQIYWTFPLWNIDSSLDDVILLINAKEGNQELQVEERGSDPPRRPVVQLARLVITIVKLSRMFLRKLSRRGMNKQRLPLFTGMCTDQLETLFKSADNVRDEIIELTNNCTTDGTFNDAQLAKSAENLKLQFESYSALILLYFVPLIPDTDGYPTQTYFRAWFATWHDQFNLAIQNLINTIELIPKPPPVVPTLDFDFLFPSPIMA